MSARQKLRFSVGTAIVVLGVFWLSLRTEQSTYDGKSISYWSARSVKLVTSYNGINDPDEVKLLRRAFNVMGTNAVPYLASRITQDLRESRFNLVRFRLWRSLPDFMKRFFRPPTEKQSEAMSAAGILSSDIKPPGRILVPLLEPALTSTNSSQRFWAIAALTGISSDYELARPHVLQALEDSNPVVQRLGINAIGRYGPHGHWALSNLVSLVRSRDFQTYSAAVGALNALRTNAVPALPILDEMR